MSGFGSMLKEYLEYYKISQTDFAERLGITQKYMNEILNENADISIDLMLGISLITDINPNLIFQVENQKKIGNNLLKKYGNQKEINKFLNSFHLKEMEDKKWIKFKLKSSFTQTAADLLEYLNVSNFDNLDKYMEKRILYKKKNDADLNKIYLWIRRCDNLIKEKTVEEYNSSNLDKLLDELKIERNNKFDEKNLIKLFNKYGIHLVIEDALKGTKIRGCMMVKGKTPTIYMTRLLKEKSSFYFALYHELSHVKTDYNAAQGKIFINDENESESKCDAFALNSMIDKNTWDKIKENTQTAEEICKANRIPLCFLYSRMAYEGMIKYNDKKYIKNRENI